MLYRLRPLDVKLDFENRSYNLGETIDLTVELTPNGDVQVREGRVDLVCEEHYVEDFTVQGGDIYSARGVSRGVRRSDVSFARRVHKEHTESYVHNSVVFLENARLSSGTTGTHKVRLEIPTELPRRRAAGTVKWRLRTAVNVVRGRDVKRQRAVKVVDLRAQARSRAKKGNTTKD